MNKNLKIDELESLRGLAALLVVFHHFFEWSPINEFQLIKNSYLMVDLFFVLSGFVIFNAYSEKINSTKDLLRFQFLRLGRLYPIHLIFLILFLLLEVAKYFASLKHGVSDIRAIPFEENNLTVFIKNLLLVQAVGPYPAGFNIVAWSISVEFYTYLIFAFVTLSFKRYKNYIFLTLSAGAIYLLYNNITFDSDATLRCLAGFFAGCLTAKLTKNIQHEIPSYLSALILIDLLYFVEFKPLYIENKTIYSDVLIYLISAILIITIVRAPNGILNKLLNLKPFIHLGTLSYSLYMSHMFILVMVANFYKRDLHIPDIQLEDGTWAPSLSYNESMVALVTVLLITLIISQLLYRFVEKPLREKSRQFAFKKLS